jgi:hypothetical protein
MKRFGRGHKLTDEAKTLSGFASLNNPIAGLVLPTGWHGRPYDNFYAVNAVESTDERLSFNLNDELRLWFVGPRYLSEKSGVLSIENYSWAKWVNLVDGASQSFEIGAIYLVGRHGKDPWNEQIAGPDRPIASARSHD